MDIAYYEVANFCCNSRTLLNKSATEFVQFMQTTYSLCSEQQLPAKPPAHRSRPGFRTALWMLPCLREPHHNTPWKIILITPSSMGNTHRYVALLSSDAWFVPQSSGSRGLAEMGSEIPPWAACRFSLCALYVFCGSYVVCQPRWTALPNIADPLQGLLGFLQLKPTLFFTDSFSFRVQNRCGTNYTSCQSKKAWMHSLLRCHNHWKITSGEPELRAVS